MTAADGRHVTARDGQAEVRRRHPNRVSTATETRLALAAVEADLPFLEPVRGYGGPLWDSGKANAKRRRELFGRYLS
jgi:hypothetical protein